MLFLIAYSRCAHAVAGTAALILPTLARLIFAGVFLHYFWASALTKLNGPFAVADGCYGQIFPRAFEAAGFDATAMPSFQYLVVLFGAWAEILPPFAIVIGLFTRLAALGMIRFITLQSLTDIFGRMVGPETIGAWFNTASNELIANQRAFWMLTLVLLVVKAAGPLSADRALRQWVSG